MDMNLFQAIKDRKKYLSEKEAKSWIYQTLKALDYMHKAGIFHCGYYVKKLF
jgi:serine/threonine protein kinase